MNDREEDERMMREAEIGTTERTSGTMIVDPQTCSECGEPVLAGSAVPPGCPLHGGSDCPHATAESAGMGSDETVEATIAYQEGEGSTTDLEDGFPDVDDLVDRHLGQYRIVQAIGRGSMGRVYHAEHAGLGRDCAIKIMNPGLVAREPQVVERFWAEARAVAGLVHPHIVTVHNLGSDRGYHYIEMEYVPGGGSLKELVVHRGPLDPLTATTLVRQVALALGAAHRAGLVHRDIKPSNVLLTGDRRAKLADFGLVRRLAEVEMAGTPLAGTPTYMAPELFQGTAASPSSDLYAVGVMFYYLLTGRLPYVAEDIAHVVRLQRTAPVPDVRLLAPETPDEIVKILVRLLAKDPTQRYNSADELADDLRGVVGHLRDTESLVHESLDGLECLVQGGRDRFRVVLPVPGDRIQEVYIEATHGRQGERLLSVFSVCAPADPKYYEFALKLNAKLTHGGISVREFNGQPMFVMARAFMRGNVTPADLRAAVLEIARRSDRVEQELNGTDLF